MLNPDKQTDDFTYRASVAGCEGLNRGPGGQTESSHRIYQGAEMQENFRLPLVLEIILKCRIDRIGHGGTIGKSNRRDDYLA